MQSAIPVCSSAPQHATQERKPVKESTELLSAADSQNSVREKMAASSSSANLSETKRVANTGMKATDVKATKIAIPASKTLAKATGKVLSQSAARGVESFVPKSNVDVAGNSEKIRPKESASAVAKTHVRNGTMVEESYDRRVGAGSVASVLETQTSNLSHEESQGVLFFRPFSLSISQLYDKKNYENLGFFDC